MISINYRDPRPIYAQICEGLQKLIVSGAIAPDEKMPSVRELAQSLAINPNTIQRAYRELEAAGYIYSVAGKGSFAAPASETDPVRKAELFARMDAIVQELRFLGVGMEEIAEHLEGGKKQ